MKDKAFASALLLLAGTAVWVLSWQSHRIRDLEALSASLRHEIEKYDESTVEELKSLREAFRGLDFDLYGNGCNERSCRAGKKESGHVLP